MIKVSVEAGKKKFAKLLEPGRIGTMELRNRVIMAAMGTQFQTEAGEISQRIIDYFIERARGGVGMITTGVCVPERRIGGRSHSLALNDDRYISGHADLVEAVHLYGAKIALQLCIAGRHSSLSDMDGKQPVAPSAIPEVVSGLPLGTMPRALALDEIRELVQQFAAAAHLARRAGYDAVEIHGAHGYLIHQFMSERTNKRTDLYGGSRENRIRFAVEIIKRIKERTRGQLPILFKITAEERDIEGGYTLADSKFFAKSIEAAGADALCVTMGTFEDKNGISLNLCPMSYPQGWRIPYAEAIKREVDIPIVMIGAIQEPEFANEILKSGKADFIGLGRALLADPEWPQKTGEGRVEDIRLCTGCNYCGQRVVSELSLRCSINPALGREGEFGQVSPALAKKRVMIVGSGPAGMEAARVAALRGHDVTLYEKGSELGAGQLKLTSVAPGKEKMSRVRQYLSTQVWKLSVKVNLETEVTPQIVEEANPNVLIVATGAKPTVPDIPGLDYKNLVTAHDVLAGKVEITRQKVAVIGGFSTGCETADFLTERNNKVIIIDIAPARDRGRGVYASNRFELIAKLVDKGVTFFNEHAIKEVSKGRVVVTNKVREERVLEVDKVVLATGVSSIREVGEHLEGKVPVIYIIGDAAEPRNIASAIYEGAVIARQI